MQTEINSHWVYKQSPSEVWEYLTQSDLISLWLMPNNFKAVVGHEFQFRTNRIPQLELDGIFYCKVLGVVPLKKLSYSWKGGPGNGIITLDTIVEWTLEQHENGTRLSLKHSGFKEENFSILTAMTDGWQENIQKMFTQLNSSNNGNTNNKQLNKMKIGIIGAGQIGGTLIRQYSKAGHRVKMANSSGTEKLKSLASETGALAVTLADVVTDVEVIVIAIPLTGILKLPQHLFKNTSASTIIIDACNYYPIRDGVIEDIENGMPESVWVSNQLQRPVIKAYNSILAGSLVGSGLPKGSSSRIALPISGDDKLAKDSVSVLINDSGFDSIDIGSLQDSWRQQPGSPVYCTDLTLSQLKKSIVKIKRELLPERRELALGFILKQKPERWMEWWMECVKNNRIIYESDLTV